MNYYFPGQILKFKKRFTFLQLPVTVDPSFYLQKFSWFNLTKKIHFYAIKSTHNRPIPAGTS